MAIGAVLAGPDVGGEFCLRLTVFVWNGGDLPVIAPSTNMVQ
jgi:hypothetical protein